MKPVLLYLTTVLIIAGYGYAIGQTSVVRGPYLQKGTPTSMVVKWRTDQPTQSIVQYGTSLSELDLTAIDTTQTTEHELEIEGLDPYTKYYYEVSSTDSVLVPNALDLYWTTSPMHGTTQPVRAWILGDPGTANNNQRAVRDAYYGLIGSQHTDMILFLGDNAYDSGTDAEYQNALFENMYEDKLKNTVAWSTLGNHDGYSTNSTEQVGPYYDIFTFPTAGEAGGVASGTEAYYSFDYANIHFMVLESYETDRSIDGAMYNWAVSDIQNTTQEWIVAMWHHPPYSKGSHDSDTETTLIQMRENFLPMLESNGVDLILAGHSHSYERSYYLNGHYSNADTFDATDHTVGLSGSGDGKLAGDGAYEKQCDDGTVYITAGNSGKISVGDLNHPAMYYSVADLGSCVMEVSGRQLDVKFLRENGSIDDFFTITKDPDDQPACDDVGVSSIELVERDKFKVFPNPTVSELYISGPVENLDIKIYDRVGQLINAKYKINQGLAKISLLGVPSGLYILQVSHEKVMHHYKFLKE